jgi:hypothetical protein
MRLVDTLAWIEFLIGSDLGAALAPELPDRSEWWCRPWSSWN